MNICDLPMNPWGQNLLFRFVFTPPRGINDNGDSGSFSQPWRFSASNAKLLKAYLVPAELDAPFHPNSLICVDIMFLLLLRPCKVKPKTDYDKGPIRVSIFANTSVNLAGATNRS